MADLRERLPERLLLGPGPSPVAPRILDAMATPTLGHLDPEFLGLVDEVAAGLRALFGTENPRTFPVSGTGSAGMEAALTNILEPGDTFIVGVNGVFGGRMAECARRLGAEVVEVEEAWGRVIPVGRLLDALEAHPEARALAVVHAETSTGVEQPLDELGDALRSRETLFVVDAVTSLGGIPVEVDARGIDVCFSGTQKCLGVPPGLAPITFSEAALERVRARRNPPSSWYLDVELIGGYLGSERRYHHTAPINLLYALHEGLRIIQEEGLEARYERHREAGRYLRHELERRGFRFFAQEDHYLPQLTSVHLPGDREEAPLRAQLRDEHGIEVGGGLGPAQGKIWRIGLMGHGATRKVADTLLEAVDDVLAEAPLPGGAGGAVAG